MNSQNGVFIVVVVWTRKRFLGNANCISRERVRRRHTRATERIDRRARRRNRLVKILMHSSAMSARRLDASDARRVTAYARLGASLSGVVERLVLIALDGGARVIDVDVDLRGGNGGKNSSSSSSRGVRVECADDGAGFGREALRELADRFLGNDDGSSSREEEKVEKDDDDDEEEEEATRDRTGWIAVFASTCAELWVFSRAVGSGETATLALREADAAADAEATAVVGVDASGNDGFRRTTVVLDGLFHENAVALKRLRENAAVGVVAELRSVVFHACLLRPQLAMTLRVNGKTIERVAGDRESVKDGLTRTFGSEVTDNLLPVDFASGDGEWVIRGYVNKPNRRMASTELQFVYLNGELVRGKTNKLHQEIIKIESNAFLGDGVRGTIARGYPGYLVAIECPRRAYSIVHDPAKTLIHWKNEDECLEHIRQAMIREVVWPVRAEDQPEPEEEEMKSEPPPICGQVETSQHLKKRERCDCCIPTKNPFSSATLRRLSVGDDRPSEEQPWQNPVFAAATDLPIMSVEKMAPSSPFRPPAALNRDVLFDNVVVLNQVGEKFIIVRAGDLLCAFDQHAADERISLEELWANVLSDNTHVPTQETQSEMWRVVVSRTEYEILEANAAKVRRWGWDWRCSTDENDKERGVKIYLTRVPCIRSTTLGGEALRLFLGELSSTTMASTQPPRAMHRLLASKACRGAIMFGDRLEKHEAACIIAALRLTQMPFSCAHGRPTVAPLVTIPSTRRRERKLDIPNIRAWMRSKE